MPPDYDGPTTKSESMFDYNGRHHVPASIQPFTNQRALIDDAGVEAKSQDNYQYRPQSKNKSRELGDSTQLADHLINSASETSDVDVVMNETHSKKDSFFNVTSGTSGNLPHKNRSRPGHLPISWVRVRGI